MYERSLYRKAVPMQSMVVMTAGLLAYALTLACCAGGSILAGVLARRWRRQMLTETNPARFQALENGFNQSFTVSAMLAAFGLTLLGMAPILARELKVWP